MLDLIAKGWPDYNLLDSGNGQRLEQFGDYTVVRPDPNVIWEPTDPDHMGWQKPDLLYKGGERRDEAWTGKDSLLEGWKISYGKAAFCLQPTPFRHMGLFPEQSAHWEWLTEKIAAAVSQGKKPRVLNLFAYTGAASVLAAMAGAEVCHVDASKASVYKAKDNAKASGLSEQAIRWIVDDAIKFLQREVRRGNKYDIILMDPPVFGRGPKGEIWRIEEGVTELASLASSLLSEDSLGLLINVYATALYPQSVLRVCQAAMPERSLELGVLSLQEKASGKLLPTGFFIRG